MANAVKLQAYSLAKTFKATALVWIEPPSPQLEQKGFDVQQIQENYLLEPMTRDFIRNWLPEYSKILSKEIKLGKFEAQMHFIWDELYNLSAPMNEICDVSRKINRRFQKRKNRANNDRRTWSRRRPAKAKRQIKAMK